MDLLFFPVLLLLIAIAVLVDRPANGPKQWIERAGALLREGKDKEAMRWLARVRRSGSDPSRAAIGILRMSLLADRGHFHRAVQVARRVLGYLNAADSDACPWVTLNLVVVTFINGGRYEEALSASSGWSQEQQERGRQADPGGFVLVRINEAEALCNLARFSEALARLDELSDADGMTPFAFAGLVILRAWILLQAGRVEEARATLDGVDLSALDERYPAEVAYTRAALARDAGDLDSAMRFACQGFADATRASSRRNGMFMVAGIAALRGETEKARRLFERGAKARYRAQAGEGLTRYARMLDSLGEIEEAQRVRGWIAERDPEWVSPRERNGPESAFELRPGNP